MLTIRPDDGDPMVPLTRSRSLVRQ